MLHAYAARFDVTGNLENFLDFVNTLKTKKFSKFSVTSNLVAHA